MLAAASLREGLPDLSVGHLPYAPLKLSEEP
jgi:hypothetical protein